MSLGRFCFFQINDFFFKIIGGSGNSNIISPVVPSAGNSQENYEIIIGERDSLGPLEQLFLEHVLCPGHCTSCHVA